jgi:hypothetical protein
MSAGRLERSVLRELTPRRSDPVRAGRARGRLTDHRVSIVWKELLSPSVEPEVHPGARAIPGGHDQGTAVAHPRIVNRESEHVDGLTARVMHLGAGARRRHHQHRLEHRDRPRQSGVLPLRLAQRIAPKLKTRWPRHQRQLVPCPLRRHRDPVLRGHGRAHHRRLVDARSLNSRTTRRKHDRCRRFAKQTRGQPSTPDTPPSSSLPVRRLVARATTRIRSISGVSTLTPPRARQLDNPDAQTR